MKDYEKKKYFDLFEEEKRKYKLDIEIVKHYLFNDYNDIESRSPTAYEIFLNEKLREGLENYCAPKLVQIEADYIWDKMTEDQKKKYTDSERKNENWFLEAKTLKKITPLTLFIHKKFQEAKKKGQELPSLKDVSVSWKNMSKNKKEIFKDYVNQINEEAEMLKDLSDIIKGVKPKKPAGAFLMFLQEKVKNKEITSKKQGLKLWDKLTIDQKEKYLEKSHKRVLAYQYKKMIHDKKIKKIIPKKNKDALHIFLKEKRGIKPENGKTWITHWKNEFKNLCDLKKEEYKNKAIKEKERYEKEIRNFKNMVFDIPKKPLSCYTILVTKKIPELKKKNPNAKITDLIKEIAQDYQKNKAIYEIKYNDVVSNDKRRFRLQMKEFNSKGYYTKKESKSNDEDDESPRKASKKKTNRQKMKIQRKKTKNS